MTINDEEAQVLKVALICLRLEDGDGEYADTIPSLLERILAAQAAARRARVTAEPVA